VFRASPAGEPLIEAINYLKTLDGDKKKATAESPLDIVDPAWRGYVVCDGKVDLQIAARTNFQMNSRTSANLIRGRRSL
jgi:hypothetical protein